jgi:hypothetical protein
MSAGSCRENLVDQLDDASEHIRLVCSVGHERSHARCGKVRPLAQVVPPREREASDDVEQREDFKREIGPTGCANGGAEPARDEVAAAGADSADEAKRGRGFEPRCFERERGARLALALGFAQLLRAEDRGNHPIGRAIAHARQNEKNQKHGEEADKLLVIHEVGGVDHEGWCHEDTVVIDIFAPPREDFLAGGGPTWLREKR